MPSIKQNDIIITDPSTSEEIGLMLAKDKNNAPLYAEFDSKYLAEQFFTGSASYANLPPEQDLALIQDDWRSGFGLEYFDSDEPKRYFSSIGMDLRQRGKAIAGWGSTGIAIPTIPTATLVNGNMELDANWTTAAGTGTRSNEQAHGGTYSWKVSRNAVAGEVYQVITWNATYQNTAFTLTCWIHSAFGNCARVGIDDGVGTTYSSYHTGGGTWEELTVTRTLDKAATQLRIELHVAASEAGTVAYFDDASISYAANFGAPVASVVFNDLLYIAFGYALYKLNGTGDGFTFVETFPATITSMQVFGSNLFIAIGTSDAYWYMNTSQTCTESNAAVTDFQYFCTVLGATNYLWGNDSDNTIRSNTNPINAGAAWTGQTTVGSSTYAITQMIAWQGTLYLRKQDKVYYLDSTPSVYADLAYELETAYSAAPGEMWLWLKKLYIPAGDQGLLESDGTTNTWRNPSDFCTNLSSFVGEIFAGDGDTHWNYAIVDNSTKVEVLAGRQETIGSSTGWVWHPIHELTLAGCHMSFISSVYQKRLWIASTSSSDSLYYLPLPTQYGNIESDPSRAFKTDTYFETPYLHGNFKADSKSYIKITGTLGHDCDADIYFECWSKMGGGSYVDAGDLKGSATNRSPSLFFATDTTSTMFRLKFVAKTNDTTKTPVLLSYDCRAILYPTIRKFISCVVKVKDDVVSKMGTISHRRYTKESDCMTNLRAATWPATMVDIDGNTVYVKYLPLPSNTPRFSIVKAEKGMEQYRYYNLMLQIVDLS